MPYDLYGTYYASARDAENAEMAQCAEIDLRHAEKKVHSLETNERRMWQYIEMLEERISYLEKITEKLRPN